MIRIRDDMFRLWDLDDLLHEVASNLGWVYSQEFMRNEFEYGTEQSATLMLQFLMRIHEEDFE